MKRRTARIISCAAVLFVALEIKKGIMLTGRFRPGFRDDANKKAKNKENILEPGNAVV